jgi:hypothetical protein
VRTRSGSRATVSSKAARGDAEVAPLIEIPEQPQLGEGDGHV